MTEAILLDIAGVRCRVAVPAHEVAVALAERYRGFLAEGAATWHLDMTLVPGQPAVDAPWVRHADGVTHFRILVYEGWINLAAHRATVSVPRLFFVPFALERALTFICVQALARRGDALLLHAAGIVVDGAGYVFVGASGRGKTTVATLAAGRGEVLSDEAVVVRVNADGPKLLSTPFWGASSPSELIHRVNRCVPLRAIYELAHGAEFGVTRLSVVKAVLALLSTGKVAVEGPESATAWLAAAERLVDRVPVYRLEFRPTVELWQYLDSRSCAS